MTFFYNLTVFNNVSKTRKNCVLKTILITDCTITCKEQHLYVFLKYHVRPTTNYTAVFLKLPQQCSANNTNRTGTLASVTCNTSIVQHENYSRTVQR